MGKSGNREHQQETKQEYDHSFQKRSLHSKNISSS
ncbi:hypothetical protein B23_0873 [Geobacillus thermoleovorans B23]|nr:hypothetical protein B23_0873 [Geobacillus thermoleovorans B23]